MKPIFVRLEINRSKDAVDVRCRNCKRTITYITTPSNDDKDKVAYEKTKKYTRGICLYCSEEINCEVDV